jgi:hypothetical protein
VTRRAVETRSEFCYEAVALGAVGDFALAWRAFYWWSRIFFESPDFQTIQVF